MKKIIQTRVDTNGDVHLEFSGFVGRDCQVEEDRIRRELASLGLNVAMKLTLKSPYSQVEQYRIPQSTTIRTGTTGTICR